MQEINLQEVQKEARVYEGTFTELVNLVNEGAVKLVKDCGVVVGIYVESGCDDLLLDELSGRNFEAVYRCKPVMQWVSIIVYADGSIEAIDEVKGTCIVNGQEVRFQAAQVVKEELPTEVNNVPIDLEGGTELSQVRHYLKETYRHCLARGSRPTIVYNNDEAQTCNVSNIEWGRAVRPSELGE